MPATSIQSPFPIFTDIDGQPLEAGLIWLGTAGNNPISSPITAYWDAALTQVVTQPVTTRGGYPLNGTAVGRLYVNADYSILVRNRSGSDVLSALNATERYDSSLVTFIQAGAGAVVRTAQAKMREVVSVKDFGAVGDGVADDTAAFVAARAWADANKPSTLVFPKGIYKYSASPNWNISGLRMVFDSAEFVCTNTTPGHTAFLIHAFVGGGSPSDPFIQQVDFDGDLVVTCNSQCTYGVRAYGLARCNWSGSIRVRGGDASSGRAFSIEACSLNNFGQLICSTDVDVGYTMPYAGIYLDTGTRAGVGLGASTNNTFRQIDMAGVSFGIWGASADQNTFLSGAAESCLVRGVNWTSGARINLMLGFAAEANGSTDIVDNGVSNTYIDCYSLSSGGIILQGQLAQLVGGLWNKIEIQSGAKSTKLKNLVYNYSGTGTFTDNGTATIWTGLYNQQTSAFIYPLKPRVGITVTASPFTWTNNTGEWVEVIFQTGTVSQITRTRPNDSTWLAATIIPQAQILGPGESIQVTYSVAPSMSYAPMNAAQA
jgi:hypothetical protein